MRNKLDLLIVQLQDYLELHKIPSNIRAFVIVLCVLSLTIIALFISSIFFKLDEQTKYSVVASSEYFSYQPIDNNASDILLRNYSLDLGCLGDFSEVKKDDAVLSLIKGSQVYFSRYADGVIHLVVASDAQSSIGTLETDLSYDDLPSCIEAKIILNDLSPIFSVNLIGTVNLGQELTDASDGYFPLLTTGKIEITDISLLTRSPYQLTPHLLTKGSHVFFQETKSPVKGILRATYNQSGIDGVFSFQGGDVFIQRYRSRPEKVEVSFFNRISSDSELAILLSILVISMQFFAFLISFLLRLKLIKNTMESDDV
ncbi:hypothetical protein AB3A93_004513 [Vibrio parahaemolyticus]|uniref:hypothetical protein n=1 Tax=Vibrio harveyi group TaxID=717610 RepID=UPI00111F2093|nr:hypothetical protein [Vibrio parahaemolyticus]EHQ9271129.1 hypothetical protein [Vibrio parahaemolyticus]EKB7281813.1 hypothetical protein [Vibrio parahaemolyticus]ELB2920143.1 hypothetical protein [Vibrio parahaemolyticus]MCR9851517.1 hypothetical protein [Vibrio parahaemolyticus]MCX8799655.1 hypothetical protein [Vibrio parahaemolyticus]